MHFLNSLLQDIETENAMPIDCIMGYISTMFNFDENTAHKIKIEAKILSKYSNSINIHKHVESSKYKKIQYIPAYIATLTDFWLQKANKKIENNIANIIYYLFSENAN